jgi:hypothetical protein
VSLKLNSNLKQPLAVWLTLALFLSLVLALFPAGSGTAEAAALPGQLADGQYTIGFTIYKKGTDEPSVMYDYVDRNSGKLTVSGGKNYVSFLMKQSEETKSFKTQVNGVLTETETVSADKTANTRVVRFEVNDLNARLKAWVKVYWQLPPPIGLYDHEYDVDLGFCTPVPVPAKAEQPTPSQPSAAAGTGASSESPPAGSTSTGEPTGASLTDLENHWAKAGIERAVGLGIANGYEDGRFHPNAAINRAEFTVLLSRALKLGESADPLQFTDADRIPDWVKPYLAPGVQAGIITGYEDGSFQADRQISRAELAVIIARALKLDADTEAAAQTSFTDADRIPQWAQAAVAAAQKQGIISGRDNNTFAPNDTATRAEAVTLILALHGQAGK